MASNTIYRGDSDSWSMSVPLTIWSAGGKFFFACKPKGLINDTDPTDANAAITKKFDDSYITSTTATDKVYTLKLTPSDTAGKTPGKYLAAFKWMNAQALVDLTSSSAVVKEFAPFKYQIKGNINQRTA